MPMFVTKMQGAGNDFIIINNMVEKIPREKLPELARRLCTRRLSIGADGFMSVEKAESPDADYRMLFFNSDGSLGEMCGNGARCISRYGYEKGLAGEVQRIETTAGIVTGTRITKREYRVRLNDVTAMRLEEKLEALGETHIVSYVEMGDPCIPHAIVEVPDLPLLTPEHLRELGRALRFHPSFPKGANVNFCTVVGENHLRELTYERGVEDFTFACGTGTGSAVSVLAKLGKVSGKDTVVDVPGGTLRITTDVTGALPKDILLTGPTNIVLEGELSDEDLAGF